MSSIIELNLTTFREQQRIPKDNFGAICTMIFVTRQARRYGLPLTREFLTSRYGGQVAGLHRNAVAAVLADYNVPHGFLGEAGRTNASSLRYAIAYATFLNHWDAIDESILRDIERWWVERLPQRPDIDALLFRWCPNRSMRWSVLNVFKQIDRREIGDPTMAQQKAWMAGMAAALLNPKVSMGINTKKVIEFDVLNSRYDLKVTCPHTTVIVTQFPGTDVLHTLRSHIRRKKHLLLVTPKTSDIVAQVIDEAELGCAVDVLNIEQWLTTRVCSPYCNSRDEQRNIIEEIISQYMYIRETYAPELLPKLILKVLC